MLAILLVLLVLATLLYNIIEQGWHRINWDFLTGFPSRRPERAGIYGALIGSIYVISIASFTSFLLGVGAAVYLEEYARTMIGQEELHVLEVEKMLKNN